MTDGATSMENSPEKTSSTQATAPVVKPLSPNESKRLKLSGGLVLMDSSSPALVDSDSQCMPVLNYKALIEKDSKTRIKQSLGTKSQKKTELEFKI